MLRGAPEGKGFHGLLKGSQKKKKESQVDFLASSLKKGGIIRAGWIGYCARFGSATVFCKNAVV
jgi:hypothetical protein